MHETVNNHNCKLNVAIKLRRGNKKLNSKNSNEEKKKKFAKKFDCRFPPRTLDQKQDKKTYYYE